MPFEVLKREVIGLSDEKMLELIDFARFLKGVNHPAYLYTAPNNTQREIGFMSEDFVFITPDFDTCLEGLEEYV